MSSIISIGEGAVRLRGKHHIVLFYLNLIIKLEQQQMNNDGVDEDEGDGSDDMEQLSMEKACVLSSVTITFPPYPCNVIFPSFRISEL